MKKILFCTLTFCFLFSSLTYANRSDYNKGWTDFLNNDRKSARENFEKALSDNETKAEALISLSILDWSERKKEAAFNHLTQFYNESSKPDAYLYGVITQPYAYGARDYQEKSKLDFLHKIESNPITNGTLKAIVQGYLAAHYRIVKDTKKSEDYYNRMGTLDRWQVLGTFDNESGGGFDKDWGAVIKAKGTDIFKNNVNAEVKWFYPGLNKEDKWFDFSYSLFTSSAINYAQTFVTSDKDQEVYLRVGVSGSLKAWVNDVLVLKESEERNCDLDIYAAKVKLRKGPNRILLQLGNGEISSLNFLARITDENANPITGLTHSHEYATYSKGDAVKSVTTLPLYFEETMDNLRKGDKENLLYSILLGQMYLQNDKKDEAIELLVELQAKYPKATLLHTMLQEGYFRAGNQTYGTKEMEAIKTQDPDSYSAIDNLLGEAMQSSKIPEVKKLRNKLFELYGDVEDIHDIDAWLAQRQNNQDEVIALARKKFEKYPYRYDCMIHVYNIEENTLKNTKAASSIIEDYNKKYCNVAAMKTLADRYQKNGDTEKNLKMLRDRIDVMPYASGFVIQYANTLLSMQRYDEALKMADKVLEMSPFMGYFYQFKASIYKEKKDNEQAIANYKKARYYSPSDFESLKQLRLLDVVKEMEDLFPKNNLDSLIAKAGSQVDYPEDHSIIILHSNQVLQQETGASETRTELAVKVLNKAGVEAWKEYGVGWYRGQSITLDKAEVIKANGQKVKAESNGASHIVFTDLEIGDVLHLDYRLKSYLSGQFANTFDNTFIFQYLVPTMQVDYTMILPKDMKFEYKFANSELKPEINDVDNMKSYKWQLNDQAAVKSEPLMSDLLDIVPTLSLSSVPSWEFVRSWYKDVTTNKFKSDYLLKATVAEILKGQEKASDLEKAHLFYNYILKTISYSNVPFMQDNMIPQSASRTITTRLGDCKDMSTLFVALCREVDIDANLVLILTRTNAYNNLMLPSNGFNHCIAQLNVDNKKYFLELTDNKLPFGAALEVDLQACILPITKQEGNDYNKLLRMDMPFRMINGPVRESEINIEGTSFNIKGKTTHQGSFASSLRATYADLGIEEQVKNLNQSIASDYRTTTKVSNLEFTNLDNLESKLSYTYNLEVKDMVQELTGADMDIFRLIWQDNHGSQEELSLETRKYPFLSWVYTIADRTEEIIKVNVPKGKKFLKVPKDIKLDCKYATYSLEYELRGKGTLIVKRIFEPKQDIIMPNEYNEYRQFMREVSKSDNRVYVMD